MKIVLGFVELTLMPVVEKQQSMNIIISSEGVVYSRQLRLFLHHLSRI